MVSQNLNTTDRTNSISKTGYKYRSSPLKMCGWVQSVSFSINFSIILSIKFLCLMLSTSSSYDDSDKDDFDLDSLSSALGPHIKMST